MSRMGAAAGTHPPPAWQVLHGVALRPPLMTRRGQVYTGARLMALDDRQARQLAGVVAVIRRQNFVGVVASQHHQAKRACALLDARWHMPTQAETAAEAAADAACATAITPDVASPFAPPSAPHTSAAPDWQQSYLWQPPALPPASANAGAGALASFDGKSLSVWATFADTHGTHTALRTELTHLCQLPPEAIHLYAMAPADTVAETTQAVHDAALQAALMSWHIQRPVRVQSAGQAGADHPEHTADRLTVVCTAQRPPDERATPHTPHFHIRLTPPHTQPALSWTALLCGLEDLPTTETATRPGTTPDWVLCSDSRHETLHRDENPENPDDLGNADHGNQAAVAAQVFARESFWDEVWRAQGQDPLQARLNALDTAPDPHTARALIETVGQRAGWFAPLPAGGGRGFAYAHVLDHSQSPPCHVRSAWIAEVQVQPDSGQLELQRVTVGHDIAPLTNPNTDPNTDPTIRSAATTPLLAPDTAIQAIQASALRCLPPSPRHDDWGSPQSAFQVALASQRTEVQIARPPLLQTHNDPDSRPLAWHRSAELPVTAAIANAIAQATGVRLRQAPLTAPVLNGQTAPGLLTQRIAPKSIDTKKRRYPRGVRWAGWLGGAASVAGGLLLAASPWRGAIAPLTELDTSIYSEQAIARGRLVAIAGDCAVCHTAPGGIPNAGGLALDTPFGTIYSTNITPDRDTGIGTWSYAAFERAMRHGIHQNGQHLYPAFPYTAFAKISDADMQALYAWLITREPVSAQPPPTRLAFPYNLRFAMAGWNTLFHDATPYTPDPEQSRLWNRGAYLVQGAGHCGACHTPRNALGAEKTGTHFLGGGLAEGWEAPALNALSKAPIPWTENSLYDYLRTGYSPLHGVAAGPMAPVVHGLAQLPDEDVRAIAHYLATLTAGEHAKPGQSVAPATDTASDSQALQAARLEQRSRELESVMTRPAERLFDGACAACHDPRDGPPLFGTRPSLALNTNLHSDLPDNVIQVLLHGIAQPALPNLGYMPGFKDSLNDAQLADLLHYMRQRFAPDKPAWDNLPEKIRTLRQATGHPD